MKLANLTHDWIKTDERAHWNLIIEDFSDLHRYIKFERERFTDGAATIWDKAKKTENRSKDGSLNFNNLYHVIDKKDNSQCIGYHQMMYHVGMNKSGEVSVKDYSTRMDNVFYNKINVMLRTLSQGREIRVCKNGSYSFMNGFRVIKEIKNITNIQMIAYLNGEEKFMKGAVPEINTKCLVIENDNVVPSGVFDLINKMGIEQSDITYLINFKEETNGFEKEDYVNMFTQAISGGLEQIIFETTMIDMDQFMGLKAIIESIMLNFLHHSLQVCMMTDATLDIDTKANNVHLTILRNGEKSID